MEISKIISEEFKVKEVYVSKLIELTEEGATVPFIARYRKDTTGGMDEELIRKVIDRHKYLTELEERKVTILKSVGEQNKLTQELTDRINACMDKTTLEDLYLPYKPKKKTKAFVAKEKGLEPLIIWILLNRNNPKAELLKEAERYVDVEKGVKDTNEALQGASDIYAEMAAEKAEIREHIRNILLNKGLFYSKAALDYRDKKTKYEMYYDYRIAVNKISSHNMLAMRRGEKEEVLILTIEIDEDEVLNYIFSREIGRSGLFDDFFRKSIKDAYNRLLKHSLTAEVRLLKKDEAEIEAIKTFEKNLKNLLLSAPAGHIPVLSIDPGFKMGCKLVALDNYGKFLEYKAIYPHPPQHEEGKAREVIKSFVNKYNPKYIVIGNGTAARETERFVKKAIEPSDIKDKPKVLLISEAGASVYSASPVAIEEFPELDPLVRGAISIGRRLLDPLSELVKVEPKSIGVGQYQHDVDQTLLKEKLEDVTESCVNYVGVDVNTASAELLSYVAGINSTVAKNIVTCRNIKGPFKNRKDLLSVDRLGDKVFEQASGFLRIKGGDNPLDDSAVHPESYPLVKEMAKAINVSERDIIGNTELIKKINPSSFINDKCGLITIKDILEELKKPGRDPRANFTYANFNEAVNEISDLKEGMILEGVITNVANFGAFVDIGVHQDGLIHISELADRFVKDPNDVVKVGQNIKVRVLKIDPELKRISLSSKTKSIAN